MPKPLSLKEKRQRLQQSTFVGRAGHLDAFRENISRSPDHPHFVNIFNIFGQGGVGKTTLTKQFIQIAQQNNARYAYTDEGVKNIPDFMGEVAEQLEKAGCELKDFSKRYKLFRQKKQELEADPDYPQDFGEFIGTTLVKSGTKIIKYSVPGAAPFLDFVDTDSIAKQAGAWASFVAKKIGNKDDIQLLREPEKVLTPLWLKELGEITEKHKVILFIDTYEIVDAVLESWLLRLLDDELFSSGIILVLSGRDKLNPNNWSAFNELTVPLPVEPFTEPEARDYLVRRGISDEKLIHSILHLSGRLPVLLATLAETSPSAPDDLTDVSQTAVERFLRWVDDPAKRKVAQYMALPREINQDIIGLLVGDDEKSEEYFTWLSAMPFFERRGGRNTYHPVVREQMLRNLKIKSPKNWTELHEKLSTHYETQQNALGLETDQGIKNESWRQYSYEVIYHSFCANPEKNAPLAINGFVRHFIEKSDLASSWAETLQVAEADSGHVCTYLPSNVMFQFVQLYKDDSHDIVISTLTKLLDYPKIEQLLLPKLFSIRGAEFRLKEDFDASIYDFDKTIELDNKYAGAYADRGETYRLMSKYEEAIRDLDKAIELNDKLDWAYGSRGETYQSMSKYEEAIRDFDRAIELDDKYAWAFGSRGETYQSMSKYEEAIRDFDRAIELNDKYAWAYVSRGQTYRLMGKYEEAIPDFDKAIELNDKYAEAYAHRGQTYRLMGKYEEAIRDFDKAIELNDKYAWAYVRRGQTYRLMGKYEEAIRDFDKAIELNDKYAEAYAHRGETYRLMGEYDEAIRDFDKAIELNDKYAWAYASRGQTYQSMSKYDEAIRDFDKAIELNDKYAWAYASRGQTYHSMSKYDEAIRDFDKAIELNDKLDWAFARRGETYRLMSKNEDAIRDFDKAIELNDKYAWAYARRGDTYRLMGTYEEAIRDFNTAIELNDKYSWAYGRRGDTYRLMSKYDEAIRDFDKAIELNDKYAWAYASRGQTYHSMSKYDEAIRDFDKAIELNDKLDWAFASRGQTYRSMSKYEEAIRDFDRVIELDDKYVWAYSIRGKIYRLMSKYDEAILDFDRAIELNDKYSWAYSNRGETYLQTGRYEEAIRDFDKAIEIRPESNWSPYLRYLTNKKLENTGAESDLARAIELALAEIQKTPESISTRFNLALYRTIQSDLSSALEIVSAAVIKSSRNHLIDFQQDLEFFLSLFSDHEPAQTMLAWVKEHLEKRDTSTL